MHPPISPSARQNSSNSPLHLVWSAWGQTDRLTQRNQFSLRVAEYVSFYKWNTNGWHLQSCVKYPARFCDWMAVILCHSAVLEWATELFEDDARNLGRIFVHNSVCLNSSKKLHSLIRPKMTDCRDFLKSTRVTQSRDFGVRIQDRFNIVHLIKSARKFESKIKSPGTDPKASSAQSPGWTYSHSHSHM